MNNLILIGNGFDLAHNHKTGYKDFIHFVINSQMNDRNQFLDLLFVEVNYIKDLDQFYEALGGGSSSPFIKFNNVFFQLLVNDVSLNNWCDIEKRYFDELMKMKNYETVEKFHEDFEIIKNYLTVYLRNIKINSNPIRSYSHLFSRLNKATLKVLNFNYTNTLNMYVDNSSGSYNLKDNQIIDLHGKLDDSDNPVIFGYAAKDSDSRKLIEKDNKVYLKYIKKQLYKRTENENKLKSYINDTDSINLFILGHSCGMSDELILNKIFNHDNIISITILYYDNYDFYWEHQININRIMNDNIKFDEKLVSYSSSSRMPQFDESEKQINEFEKDIEKNKITFGEPGVY